MRHGQLPEWVLDLSEHPAAAWAALLVAHDLYEALTGPLDDGGCECHALCTCDI